MRIQMRRYFHDAMTVNHVLVAAFRTGNDEAFLFRLASPVRFRDDFNAHAALAAPRRNAGDHGRTSLRNLATSHKALRF